ncbi:MULTISPECIES: DUF2599 domain-containing protein [Peptoniphilaceae]|uniref:DUF2599 domain-containing protein n=1 Tax=Finegoldia magna BVS033A4 TaxID=866773 RepID=E1KUX2_FINMA|nr:MULTISPECIES: DUF2599 domain-containing protein [Peptoniphilaceae]EFL55137.1 hypothetical protein HMPREF9289_0146 [Finegoldia magna BVS033A4]
MKNKVWQCKIMGILLVIVSIIPNKALASSGNIEINCSTDLSIINDGLEDIPISNLVSSESVFKYFDDVTWIQRDGIWSLSISPKNFVRMSFSNDILIKSWNELKENFSNDLQWSQYKDNEDILFEQYKCHFFKAKIKNRWNIEPFRESIDRLCN